MLRLRMVVPAVLQILALLPPLLAQAAVPSPANSTVPPCFVACPAGDIPYRIVVRDANNNPEPGECAEISLSQCSTVRLCTGVPVSSCDSRLGEMVATTDGDGVAVFTAPVVGTCLGGPGIPAIRVFASAVLLSGSVSGASVDQNGDERVDGTDESILAAKMATGTYDPTVDFNCDGRLDSGDAALFAQHLQHRCAVVPGRPFSWGGMKLLYR